MDYKTYIYPTIIKALRAILYMTIIYATIIEGLRANLITNKSVIIA